MHSSTFYANGKLLITGEYVVLDGALSLAFPCKFGQSLRFEFLSTQKILWESFDYQNNSWFKAVLSSDLYILTTNDIHKAEFLQSILNYCFKKADSNLITQIKKGISITTHLSFPNNWGLGSSSTLLVLLAQLFEIDAYSLHFATTNGSGYDIACGLATTPLLYQLPNGIQKPIISELTYNPFEAFKENIFFIHLNQKQKSDREVASYSQLKKELDLAPICEELSNLTQQLIATNSLSNFNKLMETHEAILSNVLQRNTIKDDLFQLYKGGIIKSLGAWGGDFMLVTGNNSDLDYFRDKGYSTILSFDEMILHK
jgi:mevalonate kinase